MAAYSKPALSFGQKLSLFLKLIVLAPPTILFNYIRCLAIAKSRNVALQPWFWFKCAFNKFALRHLSALQIQSISPPTVAMYKSWTRKRLAKAVSEAKSSANLSAQFLSQTLAVEIDSLPDGQSSLLWLGKNRSDPATTKIVYFFHGGGYGVPMLPGHFEWCLRAYLQAGFETKENVAVAVLQYALVPHEQYPTQLKQAAAGLSQLLSAGYKPENIIVGGDSAGGNLTLQLFGHLLHPHPEVVHSKLLQSNQKLAGAFLVSPWCGSQHNESWSFKKFGGIDMLSTETMNSGVNNVLGVSKEERDRYQEELRHGNGWAYPMDLDESHKKKWFEGLEQILGQVYMTAGEQEVFLEQIIDLKTVLEENKNLPLKFWSEKDAAHDWILLEGEKGVDGEGIRRMKAWTKEVFGLHAVIHNRPTTD
ncbi:Alpha/Beta hydrolase protein [Podospora australis]|uniref:Alpha/Beta hydrolase protein n=1 Tax=Podospora australis TaxID=1536484 RepID=A0AAN6WPU4_9PEZI|nr:Alpha/Beta hydrolase protein [Podospora australis]